MSGFVLALVPFLWVFFIAPWLGLPWYRLTRLHWNLAVVLFGATVGAAALGFVSLRRITRSREALGGHGFAVTGMALGCLGCVILLVYPGLLTIREIARRDLCGSNLKQIGLTLLMYSNDNEGMFPPTLQTLVGEGNAKDPWLFVCESAEPRRVPFDAHDVDRTGDYYYARAKSDEAPPMVAIAWDKRGNHEPSGGWMLFVDGRVCWVEAGATRKCVEDGAAYYVTPPELPPGP